MQQAQLKKGQFSHYSKAFMYCAILTPSLLLFPSVYVWAGDSVKTVWYRYYDKNGVANLSNRVTPNHIRYGYDSLDINMQVIHHNQPFNSIQDLKFAHTREIQAKQNNDNLRLKEAYGSSKAVILKQQQALANLAKQMSFQQNQLAQQQSDQAMLKRQSLNLTRDRQNEMIQLTQKRKQNEKNISEIKTNLAYLEHQMRETQQYYDGIIRRLKKLE